jgi:hypothetical protein
VPDTVLAALTQHFMNVEAATALDEKGRAHELVFANGKGGPISRTWLHRAVWSPALAAVGLPKGTHFHELRHYPRLAAHRRRRECQGRAEATRSRIRGRDTQHVRTPVA